MARYPVPAILARRGVVTGPVPFNVCPNVKASDLVDDILSRFAPRLVIVMPPANVRPGPRDSSCNSNTPYVDFDTCTIPGSNGGSTGSGSGSGTGSGSGSGIGTGGGGRRPFSWADFWRSVFGG